MNGDAVPDWPRIRRHYESSGESLRQVAARFGVSERTIFRRSSKEGWQHGGCGSNGAEDGGASGSNEAERGSRDGSTSTESGSNGSKCGSTNGSSGPKSGSKGIESGSTNGSNGAESGSSGGSKLRAAIPSPAATENGTGFFIPDDIGSFGRLAAARYYHEVLGWAVHPLNAPDRGDHHERGKKPILKGWRNHRATEITPDFLTRYFANGSSHNIGCVVRAPFIHIDLDSKPDNGASVEKWLGDKPELAGVPRERTGGGAHLVFICRDLPEKIARAKKAPSVQVNDAVTAELYVDGLNIVLSPSVHKNGHTYSWEVTGRIPEVSWARLSQWFGFETPETGKRGRPPKEKPWWAKWREDLRTLDLVKVSRELGILGDCIDPDAAKWSVRCPWHDRHSDRPKGEPGSDTVIFNAPETMPAFRCLHAHCEDRGAREFIEWCEERQPGIIAAHCADIRVWQTGTKNRLGRPRVVLPAIGRTQSEFGAELGAAVAPVLDLFTHGDSLVEIKLQRKATRKGEIPGHMLRAVKPLRLVTSIERTVETGVLQKDDAGDQTFLPTSMNEQHARITSENDQFLRRLPHITRILDVPVPTLGDDGKLVYPEPGYDPRFETWLNPNSPKIRTMGFEEALRLIFGELLATAANGGFWWHDEQARVHALARLITPFCRGLMGWKRTPLWIYDGNREGSGKDTCADVAHNLYTGRNVTGAPLSKDCDDEMRKRITSALMQGARFFHLANMKGHVRYPSLEAATDNSGWWEDRVLRASESIVLRNETEFSLSANNATWEPDIERRCRRIRLRFTPEHVNGHRYKHESVLGWVREHRSDLLSAVAALVAHWVREGCPPGPTPFTSFPEWGRVVGGVLAACGIPDPCLPHEESEVSGDKDTRAMRQFFALGHERFGNDWTLKNDVYAWVRDTEAVQELFEWIDFSQRRGTVAFGKLLARFDGRELGGVVFGVQRTSANYCKYRFSRDCAELVPVTHTPHTPPAPDCVMCDVLGGSLYASIAKEKNQYKGNNSTELKGGNRGDGEPLTSRHTSHRATVCTSRADLDLVADDLRGATRIALDIETYGQRKGDGLDPWNGDIRLLTVGRHTGPLWTVDLMAVGYDLGPLKPVLESATLIAHNAKFDLGWLRLKCGLHAPKVLCTLTAARLLTAGIKPGNDLDSCLERYLNIPPGDDQARSDWGSMLLTDDQLAYAARDVAFLHDLAGVLEAELEINGLDEVWALECELLPCIIDMEAAGIAVDAEMLASVRDASQGEAQKTREALREALGMPTLNLSSPAQLLSALRAAGIALESTREESLKAADDGRLVPLVLAFREAEKRAQQAESLLGHIRSDGRIHARFEPTGTATGRFSSKEPNLQNIGRGQLREAFTPPPGRRLVVADYSQVELRAAAAIAGETRMIDAYKAGTDLHRLTAAKVLGKPLEEVTKADRQLSKSVNFGLIYGQSAPGLVRYAATSYGVTMTGQEAKSIRSAFFKAYPALREWHTNAHQDAEFGAKEVRTRLNRRRLIPGDASNWERFTALVNTPVQGGTADGMKRAIVLVAQRIPADARIVSTVHDELVVECGEQDAETVRSILSQSMTEAMAALFPEVPVEVEANICTTWAEK